MNPSNECPKCGSESIDCYDIIDSETREGIAFLHELMECFDCDRKWEVDYQYTGYRFA